MSAHIEKSIIESRTRVRADAYLEKPISLFDILGLAAQYVEIPGILELLRKHQK